MVVNLVLVLVVEGVKVGILDVDIYGLLILIMLGVENQCLILLDGIYMVLIMFYGLVINLIGYLVIDDNVMVWCGLMVSKVLMQMLQEILWLDFDYLVFDMLSGIGDI